MSPLCHCLLTRNTPLRKCHADLLHGVLNHNFQPQSTDGHHDRTECAAATILDCA